MISTSLLYILTKSRRFKKLSDIDNYIKLGKYYFQFAEALMVMGTGKL